MARQARRLAVSGIYHVMVRGIGRQALFHSAADNLAFLSAVTFALQRTQVQLINYCLMSTLLLGCGSAFSMRNHSRATCMI